MLQDLRDSFDRIDMSFEEVKESLTNMRTSKKLDVSLKNSKKNKSSYKNLKCALIAH